MSLRLSITHTSGPSLPEVAHALRSMDNRRILSIYRRQLRAHVSGLRREIRASIAAIPAKSVGQHPDALRLRLARCVTVFSDVTGAQTTVGVWMRPEAMPTGQFALPAYMEGKKAPWTHPLFGDRDKWYGQSARPYFYPVIAAHRGTERVALDRAEEDIKRRLFA